MSSSDTRVSPFDIWHPSTNGIRRVRLVEQQLLVKRRETSRVLILVREDGTHEEIATLTMEMAAMLAVLLGN